MNKVMLIGRLTGDPELKQTSSQTSFCNFTVAVDRKFKDANGNKQTDFIPCTAWSKTAEFISKYFHKGNRIAVSGSLQIRSYEDSNGNKRTASEVVIEDAEFVESKSEASSKPAPQPADDGGAGKLPFEI